MEIVVRLADGKKVGTHIKGFDIETDQSKKNGGGATAPEPFDLFLASIVTCAGYYVLDFCQTREIPADDIKLVMRTERDPKKKMIGRISIEIQLPVEFPEKYKTAIVRAADLCSVKKHIEEPPEFETFTTDAAWNT